jgi:hypothetical protein
VYRGVYRADFCQPRRIGALLPGGRRFNHDLKVDLRQCGKTAAMDSPLRLIERAHGAEMVSCSMKRMRPLAIHCRCYTESSPRSRSRGNTGQFVPIGDSAGWSIAMGQQRPWRTSI